MMLFVIALPSCCRHAAASLGILALLVVPLRSIDDRRRADAAKSGIVQNGVDLYQLVSQFLGSAEEYERTFRDLVAEETKVIELYRASGMIEKRREIVSDLLVYRSPRGDGATTEYRDVKSVDGRPVDERRQRALKLLTSASKAESLEKELEAIDRQTSRYEFHRNLRGFTIHQGGKQYREEFQFDWVGRDQIAGHEVVVLDYRSKAPDPRMKLTVPKEFGTPSFFRRGRLWLDAKTYQLWREIAEVIVPHPDSPEPLLMLRRESSYRPSTFGILVPDRIVWDWLTRFSHPKNAWPSFALNERATFTYGSFKRFDVSTSESVRAPGR
jgi:hypothetical protein